MFAFNLYCLAIFASFVALIIALVLVFAIVSAVKDWSFVIVTSGKKILGHRQESIMSASHQERLGMVLNNMSRAEAKHYLESMRDDLAAEKEELTHLRLPMSFDLDDGSDAYHHQEMAKLREIEERILLIDDVLSSGALN